MGSNNKYYINRTELGDGIVIYQTPDAKVNNWYARILLESGGYIRRSLKTVNKRKAERKAYRLADEIRKREQFGLSVKERTFKNVANEYLDFCKETQSKHRYTQSQTNLRRYIIPYFNKIQIKDIHKERDYIEQFVFWRRDYWNQYDRVVVNNQQPSAQYRTEFGNIKPDWDSVLPSPSHNRCYNPATSTVKQTIVVFNQVMAYCYDRKYTHTLTKMSWRNLPRTDARSQSVYTFDEDEINKLRNYFIQEYRKNKKWVLDENGKRVKDADGNDMYTLWETQRTDTKHMFINMRGWFWLLLWSGARPREATYATWSQLKQRRKKMPDGSMLDYIAWTIPEYKAKRIESGHHQRVVFLPHHLSKILNEVRKQNAPYNTDDDFVFSLEHKRGALVNISRYSFRKVLRKLGLYEHSSGAKRTAKHLRSYYASKMLQTQPIHKVAAIMGNSIDVLFKMYTQLEISKRAYDVLKDVPQPEQVIELMRVSAEEVE